MPRKTVSRPAARTSPSSRRKSTVAAPKPSKPKRAAKSVSGSAVPAPTVEAILAWIDANASAKQRAGMARYNIPSDKAAGVPMGAMFQLGKQLRPQHELAAALWKIDRYETRILACLVEDPARVTAAQMDRWCADFENWAICDTVCFKLFNATPHAWDKVFAWSDRDEEFVKRAAFALIACLFGSDDPSADANFARALPLIERAASDERHLVQKAVNWALRTTGKRSRALNRAAIEVAERLAESPNAAERAVGKPALRELNSAGVAQRLDRAS